MIESEEMEVREMAEQRDLRRIEITTPAGKKMVVIESSDGRMHIEGTTQYWDQPTFARNTAAAKAAGCIIVETDL